MTIDVRIDQALIEDMQELGRARIVRSIEAAVPGPNATVTSTQRQGDHIKRVLVQIVDRVFQQTNTVQREALKWSERLKTLHADGTRLSACEVEQITEFLAKVNRGGSKA